MKSRLIFTRPHCTYLLRLEAASYFAAFVSFRDCLEEFITAVSTFKNISNLSFCNLFCNEIMA
jgi:hypothetical protein